MEPIFENFPSSQPKKTGISGREAAETRRRPAASRPQPLARSRRWGLVLAGGDGTRLQTLTRFICGDQRPKQFCPLFSESTLLEQSRRRAEKSIPSEQTLFAVTRAHEEYYLRDLGHTRSHRVVQPSNKGTAPPIVYSLLQIAGADRNAIVAILPCDHYYSDEGAFTLALEAAFEAAASRPESVVLLGAPPSAPEVEYGWIEVAAPVDGTVFQVRSFHEKPPLPIAERLFASGALWNTFVMVGHIDAFLELGQASMPGLLEVFQTQIGGMRSEREKRIPDGLYDWVYPSDFSKQVLSPAAKRLLTLRLPEMEWHDIGHPGRVFSTLLARGAPLPSWTIEWETAVRGKAPTAAGMMA